MRTKKTLALVLSIVLCLVPFSALGYEARNPQEEALMAYDDVMEMSGFGALWGLASYDDHTAAWILENFKIDQRNLEIDVSDNFADIARARVAAGDIPQYVVTTDRQLALELAATGEFYDMAKDDLIYKYAPEMVKFIGEDVLNRYKNEKGELFIIPGQTAPLDKLDEYAYSQESAMINKTLLEKTGLSEPKNVDELYNYLKAVSELDFNGQKVIPIINNAFRPENYKNNTYPVNAPRMMYMFAPGEVYQFLSKNDEKKMIDLHYDHPAYLEYLTFFNKLYREKLLDQDNFTLSLDQYTERLKTGTYGYNFDGLAYVSTANTACSGVITEPYWPLRFPRNYEGDSKTFQYPALGDFYFLFNKNIADPERVAKLVDWNYTLEGTRVINYGAPDETLTKNCWYYDKDGNPVFDQALQQKWDAEDYTWNWMIAGGWGYHAVGLHRQLKYTAINEMGICAADEMYLKVDEVTKNDLAVDPSYEAMMLQPMGEVFSEKGAAICDLLNKWEVQIVLRATDEADVKKQYEQMMQEARAIGYDEMKSEMYGMYMAANPA